jgi:hypothetical protein
MNATGSDVDNPFSDQLGSDVVAQHRPGVNDEVMQRLRTPFEADPADALDRQRTAFDRDDHRG